MCLINLFILKGWPQTRNWDGDAIVVNTRFSYLKQLQTGTLQMDTSKWLSGQWNVGGNFNKQTVLCEYAGMMKIHIRILASSKLTIGNQWVKSLILYLGSWVIFSLGCSEKHYSSAFVAVVTDRNPVYKNKLKQLESLIKESNQKTLWSINNCILSDTDSNNIQRFTVRVSRQHRGRWVFDTQKTEKRKKELLLYHTWKPSWKSGKG